MLLRADELGFNRRGPLDPAASRALTRAIEQAGIRPPGRGRRVGDYELTKMLTEGDNWQDFATKHAATGVGRRVRIYPYARAASPEARERLARTAQREFRALEGVEHQGIQRVLDYRDAEQGPALLFEHDPAWMRLDYLTGVGDKVRREIRERAKRLAQLRRDLVPGGGTEDEGNRASVDRLTELLIPRRPAGDERQEDRILARYLGIEPEDAPA